MAMCLMVLLAPLLAASSAGAASESEPNNDIISAYGPILPSPYTGTLEGEFDDDWYWLQLAGGQQVTFSATFNNQECFFPDATARLLDYYGSGIASLSGPTFEPGVRQEYRYTTPTGGGTYYVEVQGRGNSGCEYEFELTPPSAFAPAPPKPPIISLAEPDDFSGQAHPIGAGVLYAGGIDTVNDSDRLYFDAKANQLVSIEIAGGGCEGNIEASMAPPKGSREFSQTAYGSSSSRGAATIKTLQGGHFDVTVRGDLGCEWQLLLSPAAALDPDSSTATHFNPCRRAKRAVARHRYRLHRLQRTLRFASAARAPSIRHQISSQKRAIRAAKSSARSSCPKKRGLS
jgi:hypothetical protein